MVVNEAWLLYGRGGRLSELIENKETFLKKLIMSSPHLFCVVSIQSF